MLLGMLARALANGSREVAGRRIRLTYRDARPASQAGTIDIEAVLTGAVSMLESGGDGEVAALVAQESPMVVAVPEMPMYRSALYGCVGGYIATFINSSFRNVPWLASELFTAAGVSRSCCEQGITSLENLEKVQLIAAEWGERFIACYATLPSEVVEAIRVLRNVRVPARQSPDVLRDAAIAIIRRLRKHQHS